jgi:6-phosphogluconolactonase
MVREAMLDSVPVPAANIHRVRAEEPAAVAAAAYEQELRDFFQPAFEPATSELPRFDLNLMGLGPDAHTASLFPGTPVIHETERWVAAPWVEAHHTFRITCTPPVLNAAARILFLVSGAEKAEAVRAVLEGPRDVDRYPAQVITPARGGLVWLLDREAAGLLGDTRS